MSVESWIEGGERADARHHHRHRMRVAPEAVEEPVHLLMHHRVARDAIVEVGLLRGGRQFAVEKQVAGLEEIAVLGELVDRIAAVEQHALVAIDISDLGFRARGRGEARIEGEHARLGVELADVDDRRVRPCPLRIGSSTDFPPTLRVAEVDGGASAWPLLARVAEVGVIERLPTAYKRSRTAIGLLQRINHGKSKPGEQKTAAIADSRS